MEVISVFWRHLIISCTLYIFIGYASTFYLFIIYTLLASQSDPRQLILIIIILASFFQRCSRFSSSLNRAAYMTENGSCFVLLLMAHFKLCVLQRLTLCGPDTKHTTVLKSITYPRHWDNLSSKYILPG